MRRLFVALALFGLVFDAHAGEYELPDLPTLRGSSPFVPAAPTFRRWSGIYAGGQVGYGSAHMDFSGATKQLYAFMLRELALENEQHPSEWKVLGAADNGGSSVGGFVGFNSQWDDVILGFDIHYDKTSFFQNAPASPIGRRTSAGGNVYDVTLDGSASMRIKDWGAGRVRAGYVMGNFLPYATAGFAVGRADITRTATVNGQENPPNPPTTCETDIDPPICVPFTYSSSEGKKNAWIFGWAAGVGMDFLVTPDIFVRAEYEYVAFTAVSGIKATISTARVGAGVKF
jgi:outer membrane immunogenic protein